MCQILNNVQRPCVSYREGRGAYARYLLVRYAIRMQCVSYTEGCLRCAVEKFRGKHDLINAMAGQPITPLRNQRCTPELPRGGCYDSGVSGWH